jgi:hypothetical protein
MIAKMLACIGVALAAVAQLAAAPAAARDCEAWKGESEIRCLSKGQGATDGEVVTLRNASSDSVTFTVQEWYSQCGLDAEDEPSLEKTYTLAAGESGKFRVTPSMAKTHDPCTEVFVYRCISGAGQGVDCRTQLQSDIGPPSTAGAPSLRRACEPWKKGLEMRCVGTGGVPETLTIGNQSSKDIWFSLQEWYSACLLPHEGPPSGVKVQHLAPYQAISLPIGFAWDGEYVPSPQNRCTEIYIFKCRDAAKTTRCTADLVATVGQ